MANADAEGAEAWLDVGGTRVLVGPGGVLVGRDPGCDLVLSDPAASRHHAVVVASRRGPEAVALGRQDLRVNGQPTRTATLADGDRIEVPGLELVLRLAARPAGDGPGWCLSLPGDARVRVPDAGLLLGATVSPTGWPPGALALRPAGDRLEVRGAVPWTRNGVPIAPGVAVGVLPGDVLGHPGASDLAVERPTGGVAPTTGPADTLPARVELQFLARGGRLVVESPGGRRVAWIAERRFALLVCLLAPPAPLSPGDDVADEIVVGGVWPRQRNKSRVDVNVLLKRLRADLAEADLPADLVVRGEGGGATRFRLAPGAVVVVT